MVLHQVANRNLYNSRKDLNQNMLEKFCFDEEAGIEIIGNQEIDVAMPRWQHF